MASLQQMVDKSFRGQSNAAKERVAVADFCSGLIEREEDKLVSVQANDYVSKALNGAASGVAFGPRPGKLRTKYKNDKYPLAYFVGGDDEQAANESEENYEVLVPTVDDDYEHEDGNYPEFPMRPVTATSLNPVPSNEQYSCHSNQVNKDLVPSIIRITTEIDPGRTVCQMIAVSSLVT